MPQAAVDVFFTGARFYHPNQKFEAPSARRSFVPPLALLAFINMGHRSRDYPMLIKAVLFSGKPTLCPLYKLDLAWQRAASRNRGSDRGYRNNRRSAKMSP